MGCLVLDSALSYMAHKTKFHPPRLKNLQSLLANSSYATWTHANFSENMYQQRIGHGSHYWTCLTANNLQRLINLPYLDRFYKGQKFHRFDTEVTWLPYFKLLKMKQYQDYFSSTKQYDFPLFLLNTWAVLTKTLKNNFR